MKNQKLLRLVFAAMFTALICVATLVIRVPSPTNGYVNFGDCFILVAAWVLGPFYGFAAGGIGSALADLFSGYAHYGPGTLVIKGLIALSAALVTRAVSRKAPRLRLLGYAAGAAVGEAIMIVGYFGYSALLLGKGFGAWASVPGNTVQGLFGLVAGTLVIRVLSATGVLKKIELLRRSP
ncbi:MAG: ECF transporter S component [Eubacterium sp.]|nr:ECF transporter S component [Eubacterium sp.]